MILEKGEGIYIVPLLITLEPVPRKFRIIQLDCIQLTPDYPLLIILSDGMEFTTIRQEYMYRMVECKSPSNHQLLDRILQTENSFQLHQIQAGIKLTDDCIGKHRNSVLEEIVVGRFTQHNSLLRPLFNVDVALPFINACEYDVYGCGC